VATIAHLSEAQGTRNEDFRFSSKITDKDILVVGDFARTSYAGVNKLAVEAVEEALTLPDSICISPALLLVQVVTCLNNRLLNMRIAYPDMSFQCCVVLSALCGTSFYYLPVGDCRVAIRRGKVLFLLNGSIWSDTADHYLPPMITLDQKMHRGVEEAPQKVLGVIPIAFSESDVRVFDLNREDTVLLYSDGVDKALSPTKILELLVSRPAQDSPEEAARRILTEVRAQMADDDRTVLIAMGPHVSPSSEAMADERRRFDDMQKQTENKVAALQGQLQSLEKLNQSVTSLKGDMIKLIEVVRNLPTINAIAEAVTSRSRDEDRLEEIGSEMNNAVTRLNLLTDRVNDVVQELYLKRQSVTGSAEPGAPKEPEPLEQIDLPISAINPVEPTIFSLEWLRVRKPALIGIVAYKLYSSSTSDRTVGVQTGPLPETSRVIVSGADGRTLFLTSTAGNREALGYYIQVGKETEFITAFGSRRFISKNEAVEALRNQPGDLVVPTRNQLRPPVGQGFWSVEASDVNALNRCEPFLARVNNKTPKHVHTSLDDLKNLNPKLRCEELQPGDELIVYVGSP
jgi:stage II sporulation SpoE-like protein